MKKKIKFSSWHFLLGVIILCFLILIWRGIHYGFTIEEVIFGIFLIAFFSWLHRDRRRESFVDTKRTLQWNSFLKIATDERKKPEKVSELFLNNLDYNPSFSIMFREGERNFFIHLHGFFKEMRLKYSFEREYWEKLPHNSSGNFPSLVKIRIVGGNKCNAAFPLSEKVNTLPYLSEDTKYLLERLVEGPNISDLQTGKANTFKFRSEEGTEFRIII